MSETTKTKSQKTSSKIKVGVVNLGYEFEKLVPAYLALQLLSNEDVKSFKLTLNPSSFSKFDDLLVEISYKNKNLEKFALQLKHRQSGRDKLKASEEFTGRKSDKQAKSFNISEYTKAYYKLDEEFRNDYKCVLYTNSKFENIHENQIYVITDLSERSDVLNSGKVYQLKDHRSEENNEFFENFLLFSEQNNVEQLKNSIIDKFERYYKADTQRATCYIDFFGEVRQQNYTDTELTKAQVILKIMDLLLTKYVLKMRLPEDQLKFRLIEEAIGKFDLTVIPKNCQNLENNRQPLISEDDIIQLKSLKAIAMKNPVSMKDEKNFLVTCQLGKKPLFLHIKKNNRDIIYEGIKLSKTLENIKIKIVLVDKKFNREQFEKFKILQSLSDLRKLKELYEQLTNEIKISLQGRKIQPIQTFADFGIYLDKFINLSDIIESEVLSIGIKTEELPQPFIERRLLLSVVTYKFLNKICQNETVLIYCQDCSEFKEILKKENPNVNILDLLTYEMSSDQYKSPVIVLADEKSDKYKDITQLTVRENNLLQFVNDNEKIEAKRTFFTNGRLSLVCGEPGTGKTTMMKYLALKPPLNYWVVPVALIEMRQYFHEKTVKEIIFKYLKEKKGTDNKIVEYFWRKNTIIFMMDGLDEIDKKEIDTAIEIIKELIMNYKVLIFCRENLRNNLLKKLNIDVVYTIRDLSTEDQKSYIDSVLQKNNVPKERVDQILVSIFGNESKCINLDLLKKPLYLYIFTETIVNYRTFSDNILLTPTKLYSEFIEGKFCHYLRKHKGEYLNQTVIIKRFKRYCLKEYEIAALQICLMEEDFKCLNLENDEVFVKEIAENDDLGLIPRISNNRFIYFHHTVAEYLSALWFSENILKISWEKRKILLHPKYVGIKYFFDRILAEDKPLHSAVLEQSYQDVVSLAEKHLDDLDNGGRTPIHLVSSTGHSSTLQNEDVFDFPNFSQTDEPKMIEKIAQRLLQLNPDLMKKDKIFEWNCIQYADACHSLCILEQLSKKLPLEWRYLTNLSNSMTTKKENRPLLHIVIENNYENIAKILIENNFDLTSVDEKNQTALHEAAFWGRINIVRSLLEQNIDIEHTNHRGRTALQLAAKMGHIDIVELLIAKGAQVDTVDEFQRTPLIKAAYRGDLNVVKFLIEKGADVNSKNFSGYTPLHRAALMGHLPVVEYLIEKKANIEAVNQYFKTPLHLAAYSGRDTVVKCLIDKGSNIEAEDEEKRTPLQIAEEKKHINIINLLRRKAETITKNSANLSNKNENPLHDAAQNNDLEKVEHLLSTGIDINQADDRGNTILHIACYEGHEELVKYLLQAGADPNITANRKRCPLHAAALRGHTKIVETFLNNVCGIVIDARDKLGQTPLHLAAHKGHFEALKLLINAGDADLTDNFGTTLFQFAVCGGNREIIEFLRNRGAKVDTKNKNGETCLIRAARLQCTEGVEYIAKNCPEILNEVNIHRQTALHCAAELGYEDVVRIIVEAGADTKLKNDNKLTALDVAKEFGRDGVVNFLKMYTL